MLYSFRGISYALCKPRLLWLIVPGQLSMVLWASGDYGRAQAPQQLQVAAVTWTWSQLSGCTCCGACRLCRTVVREAAMSSASTRQRALVFGERSRDTACESPCVARSEQYVDHKCGMVTACMACQRLRTWSLRRVGSIHAKKQCGHLLK